LSKLDLGVAASFKYLRQKDANDTQDPTRTGSEVLGCRHVLLLEVPPWLVFRPHLAYSRIGSFGLKARTSGQIHRLN